MFYARVTTTPLFSPRWELNQLFDDAFARAQLGQSQLAQPQLAQSEWTPAVNIRENETALTFAVELPGVKLENVEVTANDGVLTIHGHKTEDRKEGEEGRYHLVERSYGSFTRRFQLPQGVDGDKIEADVADGMLEVRIPKAAMPQPKRIPIQSAVGVRAQAPQPLANGDRKESPKKLSGSKQFATAGV
jgi:HSP20 family protein